MWDVLLVNPPVGTRTFIEHIGLGALAAYIRNKGFTVKIIDSNVMGLDIFETYFQIMNNPAAIIGFSITFSESLNVAGQLAENIKLNNEEQFICLGGNFATLAYKEILEENDCFDAIILGEGEHTLFELLECIINKKDWRGVTGVALKNSDKQILHSKRELADIDTLPFPSRDMLKNITSNLPQNAVVASSKGCYGNCSFCSIIPFYQYGKGKIWRGRSAKLIVDEIKMLYEEFNITYFWFVDDEFIGPGNIGKERAYEFSRLLIEAALPIKYYFACRVDSVDYDLFDSLKKSGLVKVMLGVESGNNQGLVRLNKRVTIKDNIRALKILRDLELSCQVGFILIDPYTTKQDLQDNINFLKEYDEDNIFKLNRLEVNIGASIVDTLKRDGMLIGDYKSYDYVPKDKFVAGFWSYAKMWAEKFNRNHSIVLSVERFLDNFEHISNESEWRSKTAAFREMKCKFIPSLSQLLIEFEQGDDVERSYILWSEAMKNDMLRLTEHANEILNSYYKVIK